MGPLPSPYIALHASSSFFNQSWYPLPRFDDLPSCEGTPQGCAWGVFDGPNTTDVYGTLNLLTEEVIRNARDEITEGVSISLSWPLDGMKADLTGRKALNHTLLTLKETGLGEFGWDEEISLNTQISSHWDSYCHWPHQTTGLTYNGFQCTEENFENAAEHKGILPTQENWLQRGGIVGRAVLLDYINYAETHGIQVSPFEYHPITAQDLEDVAAAQNVELRFGDILLVRTGLVGALTGLSAEEQLGAMSSGASIGLEPSRSMARWVWDHHLAAIAADNLAVEAMGPNSTAAQSDFPSLPLHHWFLTMFGLPIGEIWDLENLSEHCRKSGKYSFFLTSIPLNIPGLIASPLNALAIF